MSKDNKGNKIVYFPKLKERLFEKGIDALQSSNLEEAVKLIEQAHEMDPSDGEIGAALVVSLYESKRYQKAKEICKELLHEGQGDYFKIVELYLMILIQLNEHKEVVGTISALFDEKEVPLEKEEHFSKLLSFSSKVLQGKEPPSPLEPVHPVETSKILEEKDLQEQTFILAELVNRNIRPYIPELVDALESEETHPFIQTMIVNVMREHGFNEEVVVNKFGKKTACIPGELEDVFQTDFYLGVIQQIEELMAQRNPSLQQQVIESFSRHSFLLYPSRMDWSYELVALAYLAYGLNLYGEGLSSIGMEERKEQYSEELKSIHSIISELETVTSPVI
jgi:tetratricopeptide (TPR) repeat protein